MGRFVSRYVGLFVVTWLRRKNRWALLMKDLTLFDENGILLTGGSGSRTSLLLWIANLFVMVKGISGLMVANAWRLGFISGTDWQISAESWMSGFLSGSAACRSGLFSGSASVWTKFAVDCICIFGCVSPSFTFSESCACVWNYASVVMTFAECLIRDGISGGASLGITSS